jgi:hypothetical protein
MSFDAYVQFHAAGLATGIPADTVRAVFPVPIETVDDDYWMLHFAADATTDLLFTPPAPGSPLLHSLTFHRPCGDARLWHGLWELLDHPGAIFLFPGCRAPLVRRTEAADAMPAALANGFDATVHVGDAIELRRRFEHASQDDSD